MQKKATILAFLSLITIVAGCSKISQRYQNHNLTCGPQAISSFTNKYPEEISHFILTHPSIQGRLTRQFIHEDITWTNEFCRAADFYLKPYGLKLKAIPKPTIKLPNLTGELDREALAFDKKYDTYLALLRYHGSLIILGSSIEDTFYYHYEHINNKYTLVHFLGDYNVKKIWIIVPDTGP